MKIVNIYFVNYLVPIVCTFNHLFKTQMCSNASWLDSEGSVEKGENDHITLENASV